LLSLSEARAVIEGKAVPREAVRLPLARARGRLLREDVVAEEDLPAFDRSAMDGYAFAADDPSERFRVVAEIQPGPPPEGLELQRGECVRVYTGGAIPRGASVVLMQENARREGEWMMPTRRDEETHIRRRGEDVRKGDAVLRAGARLGPAELALLAHLGKTEPLVSPAPRVLHVATGRELVAPEVMPAPGEIRDSNSTLLAAELAAAGAELVAQSRCGDDLEALVGAISAHESGGWDLLLISGGASVGDYDFGQRALAALGFTVHFSKLDLRPGKPLIFATRGAQLAFVIPGNPVSHFVLFHLVISEALAVLEGEKPARSLMLAQLAAPLEGKPNPRTTYWPVRLAFGRTGMIAHPLRWQSSGDLSGLVGVNGLLLWPANTAAPEGAATCIPLRNAVLRMEE
jgi:molybdopterin molybdotransferase